MDNDSPAAAALTDAEVIDAFLASKGPGTRRVYADTIRVFREWAHRPLREVNPVLVSEWWRSLEGQELATRARKLKTLRSLYRFAQSLSYVTANPFRWIPTPQPPDRTAQHILTTDEAQQLLDFVRPMPRVRALVALLLGTGISIGEVAIATWADVGLLETGDWVLWCRNRAEADKQWVVLRADVFEAVDAWRMECQLAPLPNRDTTPLFQHTRLAGIPASAVALSDLIARYAHAAGLDARVTAQWLRNTHAGLALLYGAGQEQIQQALALKLPSSTDRYLKGAVSLAARTSEYLPLVF